jgi:predicted lipid-binding transport protein (Tim44 family)
MKKGFMVMLALALFFTLGFGQYADAKPRGGGIKSPKQSVTQNPKKSENVNQSNPGTKAGTTAGKTKPGFFSGGGLMKGMMIGGLAGLMFGSMFAGMGAFGNILGFMINLLAIFAIIMLIRVAFVYLRSKRNPPDQRRPY